MCWLILLENVHGSRKARLLHSCLHGQSNTDVKCKYTLCKKIALVAEQISPGDPCIQPKETPVTVQVALLRAQL